MLLRPTRFVCIREVQNSLKESVRQLVVDKIAALRVQGHFRVLEDEIRAANGGLMIFKGMQSYNAENIKSLEGFDRAWVEEAQTLSERSLRMLRPTIRKPGSEIWFTFNPRYETDAVDRFLRGKKPPDDAIVRMVNWQDNPWFPEVMRQEMRADYAADPEMADHVWGGDYEKITEAAYFARQIAAAEREGRVGLFPHDPTVPVMTAWDLGVDDYTAIWFAQSIEGKPRIIDYYESSGLMAPEIFAQGLPEYTPDLFERTAALVELGRDPAFDYSAHFFPHDIAVREWGSRSRVETVMQLGVPGRMIHRGKAAKADDKINAGRALMGQATFNRTERVMLGLSRLRRFRRKENTNLGMLAGPLHDENSHGADAWTELAVNWPRDAEERPAPPQRGGVMLAPPPDERTGAKRTRLL